MNRTRQTKDDQARWLIVIYIQLGVHKIASVRAKTFTKRLQRELGSTDDDSTTWTPIVISTLRYAFLLDT